MICRLCLGQMTVMKSPMMNLLSSLALGIALGASAQDGKLKKAGDNLFTGETAEDRFLGVLLVG